MSSVRADSIMLFMSMPVVGVSAPPMRSNIVGESSLISEPTRVRDAAGVSPSRRKTNGAI